MHERSAHDCSHGVSLVSIDVLHDCSRGASPRGIHARCYRTTLSFQTSGIDLYEGRFSSGFPPLLFFRAFPPVSSFAFSFPPSYFQSIVPEIDEPRIRICLTAIPCLLYPIYGHGTAVHVFASNHILSTSKIFTLHLLGRDKGDCSSIIAIIKSGQ